MRRMTIPFALVAFAGCGDPVLPSDYAGPPAAAVSGNVIGLAIEQDAQRPRMSLEWLVGDADTATSLVGQALSLRRSSRLQNDWDIGLWLPTDDAKIAVPVDAGAGAGARVGVGKMVYFDDRNNIGRIDWSCVGPTCNRVLAVSSQFVLYVEQSSYCQQPGKTTPQLGIAAGYHYFTFDPTTRVMVEQSSSDSMSFALIDKSPADSLPVHDLVDFRTQLWRNWHFGSLRGCE
jgi:hypothetical protein